MVTMIITITSTTNNTITTTTITNIIIIMSKMNFSWLSSWSSTRWDITDRQRPTNLVNLSHPHSAHNAIGREQQESHWQTAEKYQMIGLYLEREAFFEQRLKIQDNKNSNDQNSNHALQDSLRHTLESNRHLWNPMGDLGPFLSFWIWGITGLLDFSGTPLWQLEVPTGHYLG